MDPDQMPGKFEIPAKAGIHGWQIPAFAGISQELTRESQSGAANG
jgi:hypothetical protein